MCNHFKDQQHYIVRIYLKDVQLQQQRLKSVTLPNNTERISSNRTSHVTLE